MSGETTVTSQVVRTEEVTREYDNASLRRMVDDARKTGALSPELDKAIQGLVEADADRGPKGSWLRGLFFKNGVFSKTAVILIVSWIMGLGMWVVQGLFGGSQMFWGLTIAPFSSGDFLAVVGAASSLYWSNHNIKTAAAVS